MKRTLLLTCAVFLAMGVVRLATVVGATDPAQFRVEFQAWAEAETGQRLEAGSAVRTWLPPGVELQHARLAAPDPALRFEAERVHLAFSWWSLLRGDPSVDAVRIESFDLELPSGEAATAFWRSDARERARAPEAPAWTVTRTSLQDGRVRMGDWRLEQLEAEAGLTLGLAFRVRGSANLPGRGRITDVSWEVGGLRGFASDGTWRGRVELEGVDLAGWKSLVPDARAFAGTLAGTLAFAGRGDQGWPTEGELSITDLDIARDGANAQGRVFVGIASGRTRLDLTETRIQLGEWIAKPSGAALWVDAQPTARSEATSDSAIPGWEWRIESDPVYGSGAVAAAPFALGATELTLDLAPLGDWWPAPGGPRAGHVVIRRDLGATASTQVTLDAANVAVPIPGPGDTGTPSIDVELQGSLALDTTRVHTEGLEARVPGGVVQLSGSSDWRDGSFQLAIETAALDLAALLTHGTPEPVLEGHLRFDARLSRHADGIAEGHGRFDLRDGRVPGAAFPWPEEVVDARTSHGAEGERFDHLAGRFRIESGRLLLDALSLEHPYTSLYLAGEVSLPEGALDLTGDLVLREELDAGLGGDGQERVLRVEKIGGTWRDPSFEFDREQTQPLFQEYARALSERLGESPGLVFRPRDPSVGNGEAR